MANSNSPRANYFVGTAVSMTLYVVAIVVAEIAERRIFGGLGYAIALAPALAIIAQLVVTLRFMARSDEFVRAITAKRFVIAASGMMAGVTAWGFMEHYAAAPEMPLFLVYPAFWAAFGVVTPFVRTTRL